MYRQKKEEAKRKAEAAKQVAVIEQMLYSKTETEEDSPKKDMHSARNIKVQGWKPRSLLDELNEMSEQL